MTRRYPIVGTHLDLKYLMPSKEYLQQWLRELAEVGVNALLLEYEDKFPFRKYPFLRAADAFSPEELRSFLATARSVGIQVIPLVQSLSHLEFALAHEQLADLRELPHVHTQINLANPKAVAFVTDLMDEVLEFHGEDQYFHIGADEAWHLGHNPAYAQETKELGAPMIWARHMRKILRHVIAAGKTPMVWDDIIWKEPQKLAQMDLPRETILVSWDYGITALDRADGTEKLERIEFFQQAGHPILAAPCLNWGVLVPRHEHCLANTQAWAEKAWRREMMGVLNTSWSSFATPLATQMIHIAATGKLFDGSKPHIDLAWEKEFCRGWYGTSADEVPQALRDLSANWEIGKETMARPITPVVFGYMDVLMWFKGGIDERKARGVYPLDWNDVDFVDLYRRKVQFLRDHDDRAGILSKLDELQAQYDRSVPVLRQLAQSARRHQDDARMLAVFAELKSLHTRALRALVTGKGDLPALHKEAAAVATRLMAAIEPFFEKPSLDRLAMIWANPLPAVLAEAATAVSA